MYARMRELSSKFEGVETVDVGTLSRRVRRENPDITSPLTRRRFSYLLCAIIIALPAASLLRGTHPAHAARRARAPAASTPHAPPNYRHQTARTNDDARRRKDAACPHGHKAEDADRWGTRKLGVRPGNGAPLRARVASFFLPCERGLNSHTDVITRPHLSLAF